MKLETIPSTSPRKARARQREIEAIELRASGATFEQIANHCGYKDPSSAQRAVLRALDRMPQESIERLRKLECRRLDRMLLGIWHQAISGDKTAIDRALKIMERRALMLGLDAPQRRVVDVVTHDAFAQMMETLNKEVIELEASQVQEIDLTGADETTTKEDVETAYRAGL